MTHIPNAAEAKVEEIKVRGYLLNPGHGQNGGKAAFFLSFGFEAEQWATTRRGTCESHHRQHRRGDFAISARDQAHGALFD